MRYGSIEDIQEDFVAADAGPERDMDVDRAVAQLSRRVLQVVRGRWESKAPVSLKPAAGSISVKMRINLNEHRRPDWDPLARCRKRPDSLAVTSVSDVAYRLNERRRHACICGLSSQLVKLASVCFAGDDGGLLSAAKEHKVQLSFHHQEK